MYRFRSVENLIGKYQELERQQIYFAARDELNDPMEGKRRYFWKGDKIVWENFLKHYLLCLEHVILLARLKNKNETITKRDIPIFKGEMHLPTDIYRERIQKINEQFFSDSFVQSYMQFIMKNPNKIYIEELYVHLKVLSGRALNAIFTIDIQSGFIPNSENTQLRRKEKGQNFDLANVWDELNTKSDSNVDYEELIEYLHDALKSWDNELLLKYKDSPKLQSINIEFPQMYLDSVVELTYPEGYVACFMDNCSNSSIWGTYGNNHTGVCLKFKMNSEANPMLPLKTIIGYGSGGNHYGYRDFELKPIEYSLDFDELDFFRNLGRLPIKQLKEQWYTSESGDLSICCEDIFAKQEEWQEQHWNVYGGAYLKKLPDWSQEREYRIILSSVLGTFDEPKNRILEYKFENLEAIVFGMKTSKDDKMKIIEIVKR
ncbi:DUF2971 domain-containing protein, partial [Bacillus sp. Gnz1/3]|uniref:DUF2971 domain-containing protein n=1 Tax=Bacillus sp. Gnz1/3 TaxID=3418491 RepID=UPI003CF5D8A1